MKKTYRQVLRRFTALLAIASLAALLFVAAPASAQTAAEQGYTTSARVEQTVDPKNTTNKLPFTGLDVVAIVAVGGALLAVGFGVRKLASSSTLA
jgi:V8-like Glu-specific endopeptidase